MDVEWEVAADRLFDVSIRVIAKNTRGVLARLAAGIAECQSNILDVSIDDDRETTTLYFTLEVTDRIHLARILRTLRRVPEVVRIARHINPKT